jgi:hypothetical protein
MAENTQLTFNATSGTRRVPINRNNLFFDEDCYQFELELGKDYIEQDVNQTVVLYRVDLEKSNLDDVYGETSGSGVVFKTPVELHCLYKIEKPELKSYDKTKNLGTYIQTGQLTFGLYQETLDELGVEITTGDYVGVQVNPTHMEYFTVVNDGRNNYDNAHSIYGYKPGWRSVVAAPVDSTEFNGK